MARKDGKDKGLFERPKGSGIWWICWFDQNRVKHREKVGQKSLARDIYNKRRTAVKQGEHFPQSVRKKRQVLVKEVVEAYLEATTHNRTHDNDLWMARLLVSDFGNKPVNALKADELTRWLHARAEGRSPASGNRPFQLLRRACRRAVENNLIEADPTARVKLLKESAGRDRYMKTAEERLLRQHLEARWWPLVELAYQTGLREEEQFPLEWSQVDLANRVIKLTDTKGDHLSQKPTSSVEYVHLNARAVELLRSLPSRLKSPWVFPNDTGTNHLDAHNFMARYFRPALKAAGIVDLRWHDLRHTFGSRLAMSGVPIHDIQHLIRHKTGRMTERYSHLSPEHLSRSVERLVSFQEPGDEHEEPGSQTAEEA